MKIVYGICEGNIAELVGKPIDKRGTIIKVKALCRLHNRLIFAALIDTPNSIIQPTVLPFCIIVKEQAYTYTPTPSFVESIETLSVRQRKKYFRKLRKLRPLSPYNWVLHISRKRGIKWGRDYLES